MNSLSHEYSKNPSTPTGVCLEIEREDPDVVFLQEVVPDNLAIIESKMISYKCVQAGGEGYFVAMLLKNTTGLLLIIE